MNLASPPNMSPNPYAFDDFDKVYRYYSFLFRALIGISLGELSQNILSIKISPIILLLFMEVQEIQQEIP